jgi:uncharacterized short protein YbdD (DUF466 family)
VLQNRRDKKFRLAVGSFIEDYDNYVDIITCKAPWQSFVDVHLTFTRLCLLPGSAPRNPCNTAKQHD